MRKMLKPVVQQRLINEIENYSFDRTTIFNLPTGNAIEALTPGIGTIIGVLTACNEQGMVIHQLEEGVELYAPISRLCIDDLFSIVHEIR